MSPGPRRNDPCPCGSGRKYKQCHLAEDGARRGARAEAERLGTLGAELTSAIWQFAYERFGEDWVDPAAELFFEPEDALHLLVPYSAHHVPIEGRTAAAWYREVREADLSADERSCLDAERDAWLSLWQVTEVRPGDGLALRDRLSGQVRDVIERTASRTLKEGQTVLARVCELAGFSSINGLYPFALDEREAAEVERRTRGHVRRKRDVPIERLREPRTERYLIRRFDEEVACLREGPALCNSDGDPILFTTDHFDLDADDRAGVARRLAALPRAMGPEPDDDEGSDAFVFLGRSEVVLGEAVLDDRRLQVSTNSVERADRLRRQIERVCKELLRHRVREHSDPLSEGALRQGEATSDLPSPEARILARSVKQEYYTGWIDTPVPALGNETPRAAVTTEEGREQVEALIADFEEAERSLAPEERVDFDGLRRELGLLP